MTRLEQAAQDYLRLRNRLGHTLAEAHWLLPKFVAFLDAAGEPTVTTAFALAWAQGPDVDPDTSTAPRRMIVARGFAKYMATLDDRTEIPLAGILAFPKRWKQPFLFEPGDVQTLMAAAGHLRWRLPSATHQMLIGLLAATGMRVGEALRLDPGDIDVDTGVIAVRESKFGKSRMVPVLPSTLDALRRYADVRDELSRSHTGAFFHSARGNRLIYACAQDVFRDLCTTTGIGADAPRRPRLHDLRHTFAVRTLLAWYRSGQDVEANLPTLSTYLGHRDPRSTFWYLSAAPELLALAADRLELSRQAMTR